MTARMNGLFSTVRRIRKLPAELRTRKRLHELIGQGLKSERNIDVMIRRGTEWKEMKGPETPNGSLERRGAAACVAGSGRGVWRCAMKRNGRTEHGLNEASDENGPNGRYKRKRLGNAGRIKGLGAGGGEIKYRERAKGLARGTVQEQKRWIRVRGA